MISLHGMHRWLKQRLARELTLTLGALVVASALAFLVASIWAGHRGVRAEHEAAAIRVAQLFEASLKNAMLNRDLDGLQQILSELGRMPGVRRAMILAPSGELRFSAHDEPTGRLRGGLLEGLCLQPGCRTSPPRFTWSVGESREAMQIVYPIRNASSCAGCHGDPVSRPVNGVLALEFDTPVGENEARTHAMPLAIAGVGVLAVLALAVATQLRRSVLRPVAKLIATVKALGAGDLSVRTSVAGHNEFATLAIHLDQMAEGTARLIERVESQGAYLQDLIDATPDPMLVIGDDFRIIEANAAYRRLLGATDPVGRTCHELSRGLGEPCPSTLVHCPVVASRGDNGTSRSIMQFRRADGTPIDVEIDAASLVTREGERRVVESIRPLEDKLKFSQEQRLSEIGLLANGVAHEIHNPLASIRIALQASLRGMRNGDMEARELTRYLELVDREIDRCVSITQRLMLMSQPAGEGTSVVRIADAIDQTTSLLREEARREAKSIDIDIQPDSLCVRADEGEFRMVILNLAQNALHAMRQGGALRVVGRARGAWCKIDFRDNGSGIAPENLQSIFLPFFSRRADGSRGTGLGLAISRANVERWGGSLTVDSELDVGSVFHVTLPLWEPRA